MWLLNFLPDSLIQWFTNIILLVGIIGIAVTTAFKFFIKYIPTIIPYRTAIQVVSLVLLVVGVYFKGGAAVEMKWRERVRELEEQVAKAEAQSKVTNEKIVTVYKDRVKVVKEQQIVVQEKIKEVEVKIDSQCKVTPDTVDIINNSAKGNKK